MKETLLLVEDNPVTIDALHDILTAGGYTVLKASDGQDAMEKLKAFTPDLIISDIAMPRMDGHELLQAVRRQPEWLGIPFIFLTARGELEDKIAGINLGVEDYLVKPLKVEDLLTAVRARLDRAHQLRVAQLRRAYESSLTVLANAIDVRDRYTRNHVERVTNYAMLLAEELGWQSRSLENLRFGAILHDIGKIIIPESLLLKPDQLSEDDWREIREHSLIGAQMVAKIEFLAPVVPIIRHHHERWDGTGYPDGLVGEQIPPAARIIALADSLDSMTIETPYRKALDLEAARAEILSCSGTHFDPDVVSAFDRLYAAGKIQLVFEISSK